MRALAVLLLGISFHIYFYLLANELLVALCCVQGIPIILQGQKASNGIIYEAERAFKSVVSTVQCNLGMLHYRHYLLLQPFICIIS